MNVLIFILLLQRLVCEDISGGQEEVPIPATNLVDDPPVPPTGKMKLPTFYTRLMITFLVKKAAHD